MILVTGATGHIGNVLVRKLSEGSEPIRVLARDTALPSYLSDLNLEVAHGDLRDPTAVRGMMAAR
jgi:dihydroflavonol-4-reductase